MLQQRGCLGTAQGKAPRKAPHTSRKLTTNLTPRTAWKPTPHTALPTFRFSVGGRAILRNYSHCLLYTSDAADDPRVV